MRSILLPLLIIFGACSSHASREALLISAGTELELIEPSRLNRTVSTTHEVQIFHDEREFSFLGQLEIDSEKILLVGLAPTYTRLFTLKFEKGEVFFEATAPIPLPFDPRHILADLQLALWPLPVLQEQLHIREDEGRVVFNQEATPVIQISYPGDQGEEFEFVHLERGYRIRVRNLVKEG